MLLHSDKVLMKFCVQSVHQVAELSVTIRGKVIQEEDLTGDRILHRVTKSANLVDHLVGFGCPYTIGTLSTPPFSVTYQRSGVLRSSTYAETFSAGSNLKSFSQSI